MANVHKYAHRNSKSFQSTFLYWVVGKIEFPSLLHSAFVMSKLVLVDKLHNLQVE